MLRDQTSNGNPSRGYSLTLERTKLHAFDLETFKAGPKEPQDIQLQRVVPVIAERLQVAHLSVMQSVTE